jgi:hypothetical protein
MQVVGGRWCCKVVGGGEGGGEMRGYEGQVVMENISLRCRQHF